MHAGKLTERITLQSLTETNVKGSLQPTYTDECTVWAHIISQKGTEALQAARTNARAVVRVCIRYREEVTTKWRMQWEGQNYNILAIDRTNRMNGELWFTAEVVGAL
jgi:SPP1 family predicted phage head-tail adaptor